MSCCRGGVGVQERRIPVDLLFHQAGHGCELERGWWSKGEAAIGSSRGAVALVLT